MGNGMTVSSVAPKKQQQVLAQNGKTTDVIKGNKDDSSIFPKNGKNDVQSTEKVDNVNLPKDDGVLAKIKNNLKKLAEKFDNTNHSDKIGAACLDVGIAAVSTATILHFTGMASVANPILGIAGLIALVGGVGVAAVNRYFKHQKTKKTAPAPAQKIDKKADQKEDKKAEKKEEKVAVASTPEVKTDKKADKDVAAPAPEVKAEKKADKVVVAPAPEVKAEKKEEKVVVASAPEVKADKKEEKVVAAPAPEVKAEKKADKVVVAPAPAQKIDKKAEKKEEKVAVTPAPTQKPEVKKEEKVAVTPAPTQKPEAKKEEKVAVTPAPTQKPEAKKEEKVVVAPAPEVKAEKKEEKVVVAPAPEVKAEKKEEKVAVTPAPTQKPEAKKEEKTEEQGIIVKVWEKTSDAVSGAWDKTSDVASEAWKKTGDAVSDAWDKTSDVASEAWKKTGDAVSDAWDKTSDVASKAWDKTKEGAETAAIYADKPFQYLGQTPLAQYLQNANKKSEIMFERPFSEMYGLEKLIPAGYVAAQVSDFGSQVSGNIADSTGTLSKATKMDTRPDTELASSDNGTKALNNLKEVANGLNPLEGVSGWTDMTAGLSQYISGWLKAEPYSNKIMKRATLEASAYTAQKSVKGDKTIDTAAIMKNRGEGLPQDDKSIVAGTLVNHNLALQGARLQSNDLEEGKARMEAGYKKVVSHADKLLEVVPSLTDMGANGFDAAGNAIAIDRTKIESKAGKVGVDMVNGLGKEGVLRAGEGVMDTVTAAGKTIKGTVQGLWGLATWAFDGGENLKKAGETFKESGNKFVDAGVNVGMGLANTATLGGTNAVIEAVSKDETSPKAATVSAPTKGQEQASTTQGPSLVDSLKKSARQAFNGTIYQDNSAATIAKREQFVKEVKDEYNQVLAAAMHDIVKEEVKAGKVKTMFEYRDRMIALQKGKETADQVIAFGLEVSEIQKNSDLSTEQKGQAIEALMKKYPAAVAAAAELDSLLIQNQMTDAENLGNKYLNFIDGYEETTDGKNDGKISAGAALLSFTKGIVTYPAKMVKNQFVTSVDRAAVATLGCSEIAEMTIGSLYMIKKLRDTIKYIGTGKDDVTVKIGYQKAGEFVVEGCSFAERITALAGYRKCIWHHDHTKKGSKLTVKKPNNDPCTGDQGLHTNPGDFNLPVGFN